ncbi:unnamed protein product [Rotaria sp. Silwood1]|nr:unnamed protein product [Rotaria sp. Silwood1]
MAMDTKPLTPPLLISCSQISAHGYCDNCGTILDQVSWKQCKICHNFDLCRNCAKPAFELELATQRDHKNYHKSNNYDDPKGNEDLHSVFVGEAEINWHELLNKIKESHFQRIMEKGKIENDMEMSYVMAILEKKVPTKTAPPSPSEEEQRSKLGSMLVEYHIQAYKRKIRVLSLDGGGVRGYMSIKVLGELIKDTYLPDIEVFDPENKEHQEKFKEGQLKFTDQFDYFVGTSTGGLIAFCLATKYPILEIQKIYAKPSAYFTKNWLNSWRVFGWLGDIMSAKYNHNKIHERIDSIIGEIFEGRLDHGKKLTAKNATLLDLHNLLNPEHMISNDALKKNRRYHGSSLEFVDDKLSTTECIEAHKGITAHRVTREKVLLITAYNTTTSSITVFNTSFAEHWQYLIADVLKATMAAPTYFQPWSIPKGIKENGSFVEGPKPHDVYIDGGVFANDPELTALWAIRMQWKKMVNYRILSIGTGCYNPELSSTSWGAHIQDPPYQCSHIGCTKTFIRAEYLRLHERSHSGEKPKPCEYADCSKAFSNSLDRTKYIKRTHLNKKTYKCQIRGCRKSYTDSSSLRKHVENILGQHAFRKNKT